MMLFVPREGQETTLLVLLHTFTRQCKGKVFEVDSSLSFELYNFLLPTIISSDSVLF